MTEEVKELFLKERTSGDDSYVLVWVKACSYGGRPGWFWGVEGETKDGHFFRMNSPAGSQWVIWQAAQDAGRKWYEIARKEYPEVYP